MSQMPWDRHPVWNVLRKRPLAQQAEALRDPEFRARLVAAAYEQPDAGPMMPTVAQIRGPEHYEWITPLLDHGGFNPSIAQLARERRQDPVEVVINLALENDLKLLFMQPLAKPEWDRIAENLAHPHTVVTFSDSGAHVSEICDASLQTYFLSYWIRERQLMPLEQAIRKMTFDIASVWGLHDRGLLRKGMAADIMAFDPTTIRPAAPEVAHDLPTGAMRLTQKAHGIHCTIVNGQVLLRDGKHTGALPGQVLRST